MAVVAHTPHQIGEGLALEGCRIGEGGDVLADVFRVVVAFLELNPFGFLGQGAELMHQADQKIDGPFLAQGSGSSEAPSRSSKASSSGSLVSSNSSIIGSS